jgi:hypothetical protein
MESTCYFLDALRPDLHKIMGRTLLNNRVSSRFACYPQGVLYCNRTALYIISDSYDLCSLAV